MVFKLPKHVIAATHVSATYKVFIWPTYPDDLTVDSLHDAIYKATKFSDRQHSYLFQTDWRVSAHQVTREAGEGVYSTLILKVEFTRDQYQGSSRIGLDRLLLFIEGVMAGRFGILLGSDGEPTLSVM